ncbi:hypothetical protein GGF46_003506 [Coemansia sp. RSA 552]|nr:hypothetical protein GGF46_003506 [Coemansia sp. RSA 552]
MEAPSELTGFVAGHRALVERERQYELEQSQAFLSKMAATRLQRLGYALAGLRITGMRTGLGGKQLLTLEAAVVGDPLPPTSLRAGDIVGVEAASASKAKSGGTSSLSGVVSAANEGRLVVALGADDEVPQAWNERCTVKKLANDTTYKRILHALNDLEDVHAKKVPRSGNSRASSLLPVLFGSRSATPRFGGEAVSDDEFLDKALNTSQRAAVRLAVSAQDVALVHGPPGTGKTQTMVEVVRQLVSRGKRLLVCGPSNVSVDNLVERLAKQSIPMVRLGHPARLLAAAVDYSLDSQTRYSEEGALVRDVRQEIDAALQNIRKSKRAAERRGLYAEVKDLRKEYRRREAQVVDQTIGKAQVVLCTLSGAASRDLIRSQGAFDAVVIDEATQAIEGECWIAALQAPTLILAGDHHQLPPTVKSLRDTTELLGTTLFERVRDRFGPTACAMLTTQYRMHEDIMHVSSVRLYDSKLVAGEAVKAHVLSDLDHVEATETTAVPLVLVDTSGSGMLESTQEDDAATVLADADSKLNRGEADLVVAHVEELLDAGVPPSDIAVISPYNAQVRLLKSLLRDKYPQVEIGSVDGFQGREKEAVVLSLVRSNDAHEIGFLADYRRINVAITRPRRHLCVVADSETVGRRDPFLKAVFEHLEDKAELRYPE